MTKRLTLDEFLARAKKVHGERYDYQRVVYVNNSTPVEIICRTHGVFHQTPDNHFKGKGCSKCAGTARLTTEDFVAKSREVHGNRYDYSQSEYTRNSTPVTILCAEHGPFNQTPATHMTGTGCPKCGGTSQLTTEEFVLRAKEVHGDMYDYNKAKYVNNRTSVEIVCPTHGAFFQQPSNHLARKGCPKCAGNTPLTTDEFIQKARAVHGEIYDYSLVEYVRSSRKVQIVCPEHGVFEQTPNTHLGGSGCYTCNRTGVPAMTQAQFLAKAQVVHGDLYDYSETAYNRSWENVSILCRTHGRFSQMPEKHLAGQGCPSCAFSGPSKGQRELTNFLATFVWVETEVTLDESRFRVDIMLPEHDIMVEYHGLIWHSSKVLTDPRKDHKKHKMALEHGYRTIHIYEDEWLYKRHIVERVLLSAIGLLRRIFARCTQLVDVSQERANEFYDANHLQGGRQCRIHIGLEHKGVLVACMSFDMLRSVRNNSDSRHWELTRYASTVTIVGGPSKLLAAFRRMDLADKLTSYSDSRVFDGGMYGAIGFTLTHETEPDYKYTNGRPLFGRRHKSAYQKKHLIKMFPDCDQTKTEWEICEENKLYRIYDCGKRRWDMMLTP